MFALHSIPYDVIYGRTRSRNYKSRLTIISKYKLTYRLEHTNSNVRNQLLQRIPIVPICRIWLETI
ncbi:hypothetical protein BLOT_014771 [Blomia tropicalis]|nr:hypothetical protein BLOT_014771 [Blomia tropicalis]